ncbi:unnamed protein product, partial [Cuscuta campestris]
PLLLHLLTYLLRMYLPAYWLSYPLDGEFSVRFNIDSSSKSIFWSNWYMGLRRSPFSIQGGGSSVSGNERGGGGSGSVFTGGKEKRRAGFCLRRW